MKASLVSVGRDGAVALGINVSGAALAFVTQVLIARVTDATTFGIYIYTLSWVAIFSLVTVLGLDTLTVRVVGRLGEERGDGYLRWATQRLLWQILITVAVIVLVAGIGVVPVALRGVLLVGLLLLAAVSALTLCQAAVQGHGVPHARWPGQLLRPLALGACVSLIVTMDRAWLTPPVLVLASAGSVLLAGAVSFLWLRRIRQSSESRATGSVAPREQRARWARSLWTLAFVAATSMLLGQTDIVILGFFNPQADVGVYGAATRIANLAGFGLIAINLVMMPLLARLQALDDRGGIQSALHAAARLATCFTLAVAALLWWQAHNVLGLFGDEFSDGASALRVLLAGQIVNALAGSTGSFLVMSGHERQAARILAAVVLLNVAGNVVLIPMFGIAGAAIATAASISIWSLIGLAWVYRAFGYRASVI